MDKNAGATDIYWLGGGGFLIVSRGAALMIDPILTEEDAGMRHFYEIPLSPDDIEPDFVLYTHPDSDHLGIETAKFFNKTVFGATLPSYEKLTRAGIKPERVLTYKDGHRFSAGSVSVEVFPADHPWQLVNPKFGDPFRDGECCGYILNTDDARMYFPGDTRLMKAHYGLSNVDFVALDISASEYHLGARGAVTLANILETAHILPCHYGTYDAPDSPAFNGDPMLLYGPVINTRERVLHYGIGQRVRFINRSLVI